MMEEGTLPKMPSIPAKDAGREMCEREESFKINFNPPHSSAFPDVPEYEKIKSR